VGEARKTRRVRDEQHDDGDRNASLECLSREAIEHLVEGSRRGSAIAALQLRKDVPHPGIHQVDERVGDIALMPCETASLARCDDQRSGKGGICDAGRSRCTESVRRSVER
jgi:hypothetical protein